MRGDGRRFRKFFTAFFESHWRSDTGSSGCTYIYGKTPRRQAFVPSSNHRPSGSHSSIILGFIIILNAFEIDPSKCPLLHPHFYDWISLLFGSFSNCSFQALSVHPRPTLFLTRTISTTQPLRLPDPIQDLYLRELQAYKSTPPSAEEAEAQTKHWVAPRPPKVPDTSPPPADEIQQYAGEQASITPRAGDEKYEHSFDEVFESWFDEPDSELRKREEDPGWEIRSRRIFPPPPPRPEGYKGRKQRGRTGGD